MVCTCTDLIRLVLEPNMRLSLISVLVIAFPAASLVSAAPTGPSTTGSPESDPSPNDLPEACILYAISHWLTNFSSRCRGRQLNTLPLLKEYHCLTSDSYVQIVVVHVINANG